MMRTFIERDWYSLADVADYYGVSRRTVERWAKDGKIVITTVGGTTRRIGRAALLDFERRNREIALPPILDSDDPRPRDPSTPPRGRGPRRR